jgi:hypothetical protein
VANAASTLFPGLHLDGITLSDEAPQALVAVADLGLQNMSHEAASALLTITDLVRPLSLGDSLMIYFVQDVVTKAIKIGYSSNPKKRLGGLQTATPNQLALLGVIPGGLEHEAAYHEKFEDHRLQNEWFKGDILPAVLDMIAKGSSEQPKMNVIVSGDTRFNDRGLVFRALDEQHAKAPIGWLITSEGRHFDGHAWEWAAQNQVEVYRYYPQWRKYGRYAGFKVGPQMLRSLFDPKMLMVFLASNPSTATISLMRRAEKAGIPVVIGARLSRQPGQGV